MTTFKDSLNAAAGELLKTKFGVDDLVAVTDVADESSKLFYEGCSCAWEEVTIPITYLATDGTKKTYNYKGGLADFIKALTAE